MGCEGLLNFATKTIKLDSIVALLVALPVSVYHHSGEDFNTSISQAILSIPLSLVFLQSMLNKSFVTWLLILTLWLWPLAPVLALEISEDASRFSADRVLLYDSGQALGLSYSKGVSLGDLDQDGDLDAVFANNATQLDSEWSRSSVWMNDGTGYLRREQVLTAKHNRDSALADLNNDGYLDIVFANRLQGNETWLNDRSGHFERSQVFGIGDDNRGVALGDLDNDGDTDAVFASATQEGNSIWVNNGQGVFHFDRSLGKGFSRGIALGDLDGDGRADAIFANFCIQPNGVWFSRDLN